MTERLRFRRDYWDDEAYHTFSFFEESARVVSRLCLYSMNLVVDGRRARAAQLSGVGTAPEYRRQGLNRRLTAAALPLRGRSLLFPATSHACRQTNTLHLIAWWP